MPVCGNVCSHVCILLSPYCWETVEGQRAGSWPPASVTLGKEVEQRGEVVAGDMTETEKALYVVFCLII